MAEANELPPEKSVGRLRYLNTPTSNWAAERIEELEAKVALLEEDRSDILDNYPRGDW